MSNTTPTIPGIDLTYSEEIERQYLNLARRLRKIMQTKQNGRVTIQVMTDKRRRVYVIVDDGRLEAL